jgi:AcrR family transcriptional regulator
MAKRRYTKKKRADSQHDTRTRIVTATMELHEEVGPRATTISAIAERAGVQRLTVYRHFPDESVLLQTCTTQWLDLHPPPDPAAFRAIPDGMERCRAQLESIYRYYRRTARMWTVAHRDEPEVEALRQPMAGFRLYLDRVRDDVITAWKPPAEARPALTVTLSHALRFSTWQSLSHEGLADWLMASIVTAWLAGMDPSRTGVTVR